MDTSWVGLPVIRTISQILTAGIAITAFSLLLYAMSLNLKDRVARSFASILICVVIIFTAEALGSTSTRATAMDFWLRVQWVGIVFLPAAYLHFSDVLLAITGKPSRGRRRWAVRLTYLVSVVAVVVLPFTPLLGMLVINQQPVPYFTGSWATSLFTIFYGGVMIVAWVNFARAYQRTISTANRRRMLYLLGGATAPALGSYPYLLFGAGFATLHPLGFWIISVMVNFLVGTLLVVMAYAVAFFGVSWPDRVVKSRLFKWLMRGPVTACVTLGLVTIVRRLGAVLGDPYPPEVPIVMVVTILLAEFLITLFAPLWERWLFNGKDREDLDALRRLEDRLLTTNDLLQFLEMICAAARDRLQSPSVFIAVLRPDAVEHLVITGTDRELSEMDLKRDLPQVVGDNGFGRDVFAWGKYSIIPLMLDDDADEMSIIGLMGVKQTEDNLLDEEDSQAFGVLARRAAQALRDRRMQRQLFQSLQALNPQVDLIQRMRAAARYEGVDVLMTAEPPDNNTLSQWVREALTHYWGGPKLTTSPLLKYKIVQDKLDDYEGNHANALRAILREAIEQVRPEGERRFTGEWILYNILELKFMEGRKVREVAARLAMSEADLYRKQRIAIEAVAQVMQAMEDQARQQESPADRAITPTPSGTTIH